MKENRNLITANISLVDSFDIIQPENILSAGEWGVIMERNKIDKINLCVGEPLKYKDIDEFLKIASKDRILHVETNGYDIYKHVDALREYPTQIAVHLYGYGETHNKLSGVENSFEQMVYGLDLVGRKDPTSIRVHYHVAPENVDDIVKTYDFFRDKYRASFIFIYKRFEKGAVDVEKLYSCVEYVKPPVSFPNLKTVDELSEFYNGDTDLNVFGDCKKRCLIAQYIMNKKYFFMLADGSYSVSPNCHSNIVSDYPLCENRAFIRLDAVLKSGLQVECKNRCCFYKKKIY